VVAVNRTGRFLLWDLKLPAQPVFGGLSLTPAGDVFVPLVDGRIVCIETEKESSSTWQIGITTYPTRRASAD
jgi:hypothetical protein